MIINLTEYNPLYVLWNLIPLDKNNLSTYILDIMQAEFFKAGIIAENGTEFTKLVDILIEMKKEFNGQG